MINYLSPEVTKIKCQPSKVRFSYKHSYFSVSDANKLVLQSPNSTNNAKNDVENNGDEKSSGEVASSEDTAIPVTDEANYSNNDANDSSIAVEQSDTSNNLSVSLFAVASYLTRFCLPLYCLHLQAKRESDEDDRQTKRLKV